MLESEVLFDWVCRLLKRIVKSIQRNISPDPKHATKVLDSSQRSFGLGVIRKIADISRTLRQTSATREVSRVGPPTSLTSFKSPSFGGPILLLYKTVNHDVVKYLKKGYIHIHIFSG